jgi:glycosyltransferase involved in cell wall biosynthesis
MSNKQPLVSIGLPVYNGENFVAEAIQCVLSQTFTDWELIISDNASTDRTLSICRGFADKDSRIRVYESKRNMGVSPNHNRVFQLSHGPYFMWIAHDDLIGAEFIESCLEVLEIDDKAVLAFPKLVHVDSQGRPLRRQSSDLSILGSTPESRVVELMKLTARSWDITWVQYGLIRRSALQQTPLMGLYNGDDQVLLLDLAVRGQFRQVDKELFFRREHVAASTVRRGWTAKEMATFVHSDDKRTLVFPNCRLLREHLIWLWKSSIPFQGKIRCAAAIIMRFRAQWKDIVHELIDSPLEVLRAKLGRVAGSLRKQVLP